MCLDCGVSAALMSSTSTPMNHREDCGTRGDNVSVCSRVIQAGIRKRKVMEDGGVHPLLPIPKHDLQMILKQVEVGRPAAAGTERCVSHTHTHTVGSVNMHCSRVCVSAELNQPKTLKLSTVCSPCTRCVCVCV